VSYAMFLVVFLLLPILALGWAVHIRVRRGELSPTLFRRGMQGALALATIALIYTTPWDNVLVARGIWGYAPQRVLGLTIGWVPLEEYLFFVLQPLLIGLWSLWIWQDEREIDRDGRAFRAGSAMFLVGAGLAILSLAHRLGDPGAYLVAIGMWGWPPLLVQTLFGADILYASRRALLLRWVPPALFLSAADRLAIHAGIWFLNPAFTTGWTVLGLPMEEGLFFFLTSLLVAGGWTLWMHPAAERRLSPWWKSPRLMERRNP